MSTTSIDETREKITVAIGKLADEAANPNVAASIALDLAKAANELASAQAWLRQPSRSSS